MNDAEILEERESLISLINKKNDEWDVYRENYAGVPEYWEVQKNSYNEIRALRNHLTQLPLTSQERRTKTVKISLIIGFGMIAIFLLIWKLFF